MIDEPTEFEFVTAEAVVATYESASEIFEGLIKEIRELSRKKPETTMSAAQVKIINRVLDDILSFLKDDPEGKYLERLDDSSLPRLGDAVLVMVQFETALRSFRSRYNSYVRKVSHNLWITEELLDQWKEETDE